GAETFSRRNQQGRDRPQTPDWPHLRPPHPKREESTMTSSPIQFHKIWIDQCEATKGIRERFGLDDALHYLIGEKLFSFVQASEEDQHFAAELPAFVLEIRRIFSAMEISKILDEPAQTKFFASPKP